MKPYLWVAQATGTAVPCPYILFSSRDLMGTTVPCPYILFSSRKISWARGAMPLHSAL